MTTRIVTDSNGRKHITNEPLLHPPQRQWVGLTDEEKRNVVREVIASDEDTEVAFFKIIEAKLKEKNGGR